MTSQITGFDIGEKNLKMAVFSKGALSTAVSVEIPDNMVSNGMILSMDAMAEFISETAKSKGLQKRDAAILLPSSLVFTRTVSVPVMSEEQMLLNLPYEFRDYLTEDKTNYFFDYEVLETVNDEEGNPKEQRIFVCATAKSTIERYAAMFEKAGYTLSLAIPEEYAYAKFCRGDLGVTVLTDKAVAIVELGQTSTRVHLVNKGEYDSKRVIDLGMNELEAEVARLTESDSHIAHNYTVIDFNGILENPDCMEFYNRLGVEILKSVNFFNFNNREIDIEDIYLCGGGAAIRPLREEISRVTNANVHTMDELMSAEYRTEQPSLYFLAVCGAAKE